MQAAMNLARLGAEAQEVPVGAVVVKAGEVIGRGFNQPISTHDPTAHAEIVAMRDAAQKLGNYRLIDCDLYVTLEPCLMCVGAMVHARIKNVYFGAYESKTGAVSTNLDGFGLCCHNHRVTVDGGFMAEESSALLKSFFQSRR